MRSCNRQLNEWANQWDWSYRITLTFKEEINVEQAKNQLKRMLRRLSKKAYGKKTKRKVPVLAVIEQHKGGFNHIHMVMSPIKELSRERLVELVCYFWSGYNNTNFERALKASSEDWFKSMRPDYTQEDAVVYMLKNIRGTNALDRIFIESISNPETLGTIEKFSTAK